MNESQRGIGLPGRSDEFFSEELGMCEADPLIECVRGHPRSGCVRGHPRSGCVRGHPHSGCVRGHPRSGCVRDTLVVGV